MLFSYLDFPLMIIFDNSIDIVACSYSPCIIFTVFRYMNSTRFICPFTGDSAENAESLRYAGLPTQKNLGL